MTASKDYDITDCQNQFPPDLARNKLPFGKWIPQKYAISDADSNHVSSIHGQILPQDRYEITIDTVPKEPIVAAAMAIDAIPGY